MPALTMGNSLGEKQHYTCTPLFRGRESDGGGGVQHRQLSRGHSRCLSSMRASWESAPPAHGYLLLQPCSPSLQHYTTTRLARAFLLASQPLATSAAPCSTYICSTLGAYLHVCASTRCNRRSGWRRFKSRLATLIRWTEDVGILRCHAWWRTRSFRVHLLVWFTPILLHASPLPPIPRHSPAFSSGAADDGVVNDRRRGVGRHGLMSTLCLVAGGRPGTPGSWSAYATHDVHQTAWITRYLPAYYPSRAAPLAAGRKRTFAYAPLDAHISCGDACSALRFAACFTILCLTTQSRICMPRTCQLCLHSPYIHPPLKKDTRFATATGTFAATPYRPPARSTPPTTHPPPPTPTPPPHPHPHTPTQPLPCPWAAGRIDG